MSDKVRIEINRSTREAMKGMGNMGDTYDSLIIEMIRVYFVANHKTETDDTDNGA
jgi:hypothetical protein